MGRRRQHGPSKWPYTLNRGSPQATGLVAWWPMDPVCGTTVFDLSGYGRDLTVSGGVVSSTDEGGSAYSLVGTTASLNRSSFPVPATGSVTWRVRPNWAQTDGADHKFFWTEVDINNRFGVQKFTDSAIYGGWKTASTQYRVTVASANYNLRQSAWNHMALTWDDVANEVKLYLRGVQIGTTTATLVTHTTSGTFYAGNEPANINVNARLTDFRIYDKVLSDAEVYVQYDPSSRYDLYYQTGRRSYFLPAAGAFLAKGYFARQAVHRAASY